MGAFWLARGIFILKLNIRSQTVNLVSRFVDSHPHQCNTAAGVEVQHEATRGGGGGISLRQGGSITEAFEGGDTRRPNGVEDSGGADMDCTEAMASANRKLPPH